MDYHEIGEIFEYGAIRLITVEWTVDDGCVGCYFLGRICPPWCDYGIKFVLVEQCKKRNMEQKPKEYIEEVNKKMAEFIKKEADKCGTPPAGIKTIPKRRIIYKEILDKLFETYKAKDRDYGSAFSEMFDELGIDYAYGKLREKIKRIKVLRKQPNMVGNESLEDALLDTAGYAILTLVELKKRKE